jgi:hypothetical protein
MPWSGEENIFYLESQTYSMLMSTNDFDTDILRYGYQSMATPSSVIDFNKKDSIGLKRATSSWEMDGRIIMKHRSFTMRLLLVNTVCRCNDYDV